MNQRYRTIIECELFEEQLKAIEPDARRADEFVDGAKWILCRCPQSGIQIGPDVPVWYFVTQEGVAPYSLVLYYTFDNDQVWLLSITKVIESSWN
jgi:hypothetical protein